MIYSDFNGLRLSRLGFGCMRFAKDPATGEIDQKKVNDMFELAIKAGVNYFDTAYPYLDGKSELAMAEALSDYPRDSYFIADKFPGHSLPGKINNEELFNISLKKCRTDYFDFYLMHNVTEWSAACAYEREDFGIIPDLYRLKQEGKIHYLGYSFHGGPELLEQWLDKYDGIFDFVQIQCNYLDWTLQDAKKKYELLTEHGLGVWVMEPNRGGKLANLPESAKEKLAALRPGVSDASFAFRFLQGLPNIKVILSGMNEVFQVEDNLKTFEKYEPLTEEETKALFEIAEGMKSGVPCTGCRYCCAGCPMELDIPFLLSVYNSVKVEASIPSFMRLDGLAPEKLPDACIGCGQCAHACPQGIAVPTVLEELSEIYKNGPKWSEQVKSRHKAIREDLGMN